jgi:UDP-2,4-diacetamido-2,4,6-trideoxy-beta-L-altropyranose hydrolase
MSNDLIIRADGGPTIGMGHLMRCIALGQEWRRTDGRVTFVTAARNDRGVERLKHNGFDVVQVPAPHPDDADLKCMKTVIASRAPAAVVIDGYNFDTTYQATLRDTGTPVVVIDDNAQLPYYCADVIVNPNVYADSLTYRCDPSARLLLGPRFALLRGEFTAEPCAQRSVPAYASRVLVTMGGSDPENWTGRILQIVRAIEHPLEVVVVLGENNPNRIDIEKHAALDRRVRIESNPGTMRSLMAETDLAISAAGQTCLELAYMNVPMCLCVIADNQQRAANYFAQHGIAVVLNGSDLLNPPAASVVIADLIADRDRRVEMVQRAAEHVDGHGCRAALEAISSTLQRCL